MSKTRQIFWAKVKNRLFGWDYVIINHCNELSRYLIVTRVMKDGHGEAFIIHRGNAVYLKEVDDVMHLTKT